jgi:hypothetical protein
MESKLALHDLEYYFTAHPYYDEQAMQRSLQVFGDSTDT